MSSNELFLRPGVADYIRRFDCVEMVPPDASAGIVYEQYRKALRPRMPFNDCQFLTTDELEIEPAQHWPAMPPNIMALDGKLRRMLERRGLQTFPTSAIYGEGTYFTRSIAVEVLQTFDWYNDSTFVDEYIYPITEVYVPAILQDVCQRKEVRCGHRVSTVVWKNRGRKQAEWVVSHHDVIAVLNSSFEVPFALKRVPRRK